MASLNPIEIEANIVPSRDNVALEFAHMLVDHELFDLNGYGLDEDTGEKCHKIAKISYMLADAMIDERKKAHAS